MKTRIYTMNEGTEYEFYLLQYVESEIIIKEFETITALKRYAKKWGYELVK